MRLRVRLRAGHGMQANDTNYLIPVEEVASDDLLDYKALRVCSTCWSASSPRAAT